MTDVHRRRRPARSWPAVAALVVSAAACGTADDRPDPSAWAATWTERQALVPDTQTILDGGQDLCGERLGTFRSEMPALRPTPSETIDSSIDEWIALTETIVFECADDPAILGEQLDRLDAIAAEIDASLGAARD